MPTIKRAIKTDDLFSGPYTLPRFCDPQEARRRMALALVVGKHIKVPFHMHNQIVQIASEMLREKLLMRPQDWARTLRQIEIAESKVTK